MERTKHYKDIPVKENTYEVTKMLVGKNLSAVEIARERKMALSTIWTHIEKLADEHELAREHIVSLIPSSIAWGDVYPHIEKAFQKHGTEKLKPVFEELNEAYDYDLIRLGRILYTFK